jgi:hypothetical protein
MDVTLLVSVLGVARASLSAREMARAEEIYFSQAVRAFRYRVAPTICITAGLVVMLFHSDAVGIAALLVATISCGLLWARDLFQAIRLAHTEAAAAG